MDRKLEEPGLRTPNGISPAPVRLPQESSGTSILAPRYGVAEKDPK